MAERTLFDKIIENEIPSFKVWEDDNYLAFLTPFASVRGQTVVIPKKNPGDYVFALEGDAIAGLMAATHKVVRLLEKAFDVERVALVFEGQGVPHVHAKLYPMHGFSKDRSNFPKQEMFFPQYPGYICTIEGPKMADEELTFVQKQIKEAAQ